MACPCLLLSSSSSSSSSHGRPCPVHSSTRWPRPAACRRAHPAAAAWQRTACRWRISPLPLSPLLPLPCGRLTVAMAPAGRLRAGPGARGPWRKKREKSRGRVHVHGRRRPPVGGGRQGGREGGRRKRKKSRGLVGPLGSSQEAQGNAPQRPQQRVVVDRSAAPAPAVWRERTARRAGGFSLPPSPYHLERQQRASVVRGGRERSGER